MWKKITNKKTIYIYKARSFSTNFKLISVIWRESVNPDSFAMHSSLGRPGGAATWHGFLIHISNLYTLTTKLITQMIIGIMNSCSWTWIEFTSRIPPFFCFLDFSFIKKGRRGGTDWKKRGNLTQFHTHAYIMNLNWIANSGVPHPKRLNYSTE